MATTMRSGELPATIGAVTGMVAMILLAVGAWEVAVILAAFAAGLVR